MKHSCLLFIVLLFVFGSCSESNDDTPPVVTPELSDYELSVIDYFTDIALGFEFGNASEITRKWETDLNIFVGGKPTDDLLNELQQIKTEINTLCTDGFQMEIVNDSLQSNFYIYLGTGADYANIYPNQADYVINNFGLFSVYWNGQNEIYRGHMYVDLERANPTAQKHLLREELTQSLGLAKDSPEYSESIFQSAWTTTTSYATIDRDVIRLLYHPEMSIGLNANQTAARLRAILLNEKN